MIIFAVMRTTPDQSNYKDPSQLTCIILFLLQEKPYLIEAKNGLEIVTQILIHSIIIAESISHRKILN